MKKLLLFAVVVLVLIWSILPAQNPQIRPLYPAPPIVAGMYMHNSSDTITIETASEEHMITGFSAGILNKWTFDAGSTGSISAYADYSGTVADAIIATDNAHGLLTGDIVVIHGTSGPNDYDGLYAITKVSDNTFYFINAGWNADAGASTWTEGCHLDAGAGSAGIYRVLFSITAAAGGGANQNFHFHVYINAAHQDKLSAEMTPAGTAHQNCGASAFLTIAVGDRVFASVENETGAQNLALEHANLNLSKLWGR